MSTDWLVGIAGADAGIIERHCPHERAHFVVLGLAIVVTASTAAATGACAARYFVGAPAAAIAVGLWWGLVVALLDRLLVSQAGRAGTLAVLGRLVFAGLLGITIAVPLELRLFEDDIDRQLAASRAREASRLSDELRPRELGELEGRREGVAGSLDEAQRRAEGLWVAVREEHAGETAAGLTGRPGAGPHYRLLVARARAAEDLAAQGRAELARVDARLERARERHAQRVQGALGRQDQAGLLARVRALRQLTKQDGVVWVACHTLTVLLMLVELLPILAMLSTPAGVYAAAVTRLRDQGRAEQETLRVRARREQREARRGHAVLGVARERQTPRPRPASGQLALFPTERQRR